MCVVHLFVIEQLVNVFATVTQMLVHKKYHKTIGKT